MNTPQLVLALICSLALLRSQAASPRITSLSTNRASANEDITIFGDDFSPPSAVVIVGGLPAPIVAGNVSYLRVKVPEGALSGPVFVIEEGQVATSSAMFSPLSRAPHSLTNSFAQRELSRGTGFLPVGTVADFDGDRKSDLVVARYKTLEVFRNQSGEGLLNSNSFTSVSLPVSSPVRSIAAGDLNGDGQPDLIYTQGDTLVARQNRSSGPGLNADSFAFPIVLPRREVLRPLHVADVDNDRRQDILAASPSAGIIVFWNVAGRSNQENGLHEYLPDGVGFRF